MFKPLVLVAALATGAAVAAGCAADLDCALGTWRLTATAGAGNCLNPGETSVVALSVTKQGDVFNVRDIADPNAAFAGTVTARNGGTCSLSGTLQSTTDAGGGVTITATLDLNLTEEDGEIIGSGAASAAASDGSASCNQTLTFRGAIE